MAFLAIENAPSSSSSSIPPSSAPGCKYEYDVFLSFRGTDTRNNFTDHLYDRLKQEGIFTFRDDERLEQGTEINSGLLRAIDESKIAVVILSEQYASSRWCLIELAKIVECMDKKKLTILPVFHHVDPSDVRYQGGSFREPFAKHEDRFKDKIDDVKTWRAALTKVANLSGWHLNKDKPESTVIKKIIQRINNELDREVPSVSEHLVGMESRVQEILDLCLGERLDCVRFIGICGIGGIGKTTLAREIYNKIFRDFEASSFIHNIREESEKQCLVSLQKQLLSKILMSTQKNISNVYEGISVLSKRLRNKKVLIVLDDVNKEEQLKVLAGKDEWFGVGSIIIVTSRDRHLLKMHGVKHIYEAKKLDYDVALELFSWKAFKKPHLEENYVDLSNLFVMYADGLPLALEVLGSLLFGKTIDEWESALEKLEKEPDDKIFNILKISFDGLTKTQQELFLDIALFFNGESKDGIIDVVQSFGFFPDYNIGVLVDRSLITIKENGTLWMHDLLQEMGQDIVRRESPKEPGQRSRLSLYEDVLHVLKNNTGTEVIEGIMIRKPLIKEHLDAEAFSRMKKMRLLKMGDLQLQLDRNRDNVQLPHGLNYLSNELRIIEWHGYPLSSMPTNFQPNKLIKLSMHCSNLKQLWKGIMNLNELKLIDLSDSQNLIETPNLSGATNLKQLILQGCTRLRKIHPSIVNLKPLIQLDLSGCKCLESLPDKINLESLEVFSLSGCSRLKKFPEVARKMPRLLKLYLNKTAIKYLPLSLEHLIGLIKLDLSDCSKLVELPKNLGNLEGLEEINLTGCKRLSTKSSNNLLSFLSMPKKSIDSLGMLIQTLLGVCSLTKLDLSYCNIQTIPYEIGCLSSLSTLNLKGNNFVSLPESMIGLSNLERLDLGCCTSLRSLPTRPLRLDYINAKGCTSLLETFSNAVNDIFWPTPDLLNVLKLIVNQFLNDQNGEKESASLIQNRVGFEEITRILKIYTSFNGQRNSNEDQKSDGVLIFGREILKWFNHQNVGASVNLQLPSQNKFLGIAVCAHILLFPCQTEQICKKDIGSWAFTHELHCSFECNGREFRGRSLIIPEDFLQEYIESYLWLEYYPSKFFEEERTENVNGLNQIKVKFETLDPGLEVTKCGACLIVEQDIEDYCRRSCSITTYASDGDGAGPSGEKGVDTLHPVYLEVWSRFWESYGLLRSLEREESRGGPSSKSSNKLTFPLMQPRRSPDLMGLCSLTELDLSYCNVQTIPNALGCLSYLELLYLRGNNFVSLPESIIQLSNLRWLEMGGCTHLQMLPKLPLNIEYIDATKCTSLETLSLSSFETRYHLLDCNKLIKNQDYGDLFSRMLRRFIVNTKDQRSNLIDVMIPGSEIPKWFCHQNVGGSVNLQVSSDLFRNKLMGIAMCAVFVFHKHDQGYLECYVNGRAGIATHLSNEFGKIESYQLWLQYMSHTYLTCGKVDANEFSQIEVKFVSEVPGLEVTKCGALLVSERDIKDLINQTKAGPSSCIITPYDEDGFED